MLRVLDQRGLEQRHRDVPREHAQRAVHGAEVDHTTRFVLLGFTIFTISEEIFLLKIICVIVRVY